MEYISHGSLRQVLDAAAAGKVALSWVQRLCMASDAAKGMVALHAGAPPILHRDLRSPNLLVNSMFRVKVGARGARQGARVQGCAAGCVQALLNLPLEKHPPICCECSATAATAGGRLWSQQGAAGGS